MTETNDTSSAGLPPREPPEAGGHRDRPDLTDRESRELLVRLGCGLRAIVGDVLIDPIPQQFQWLIDALEHAERPRQKA